MVEIGSETIVSAVLKTLQKKFTTAKRYRDTQNQNIVRPCFIVEQIALSPGKGMDNRYTRNPRIKITYLAESGENELSKHLRAVGDKLLSNLRLLVLSDTDSIFGRNAECEIVAGELIFTIEYPMHVIEQQGAQPIQNDLESNIDVK